MLCQVNPNYSKLPKNWESLIGQQYEEGASDLEVRAALRMTVGVWDSLYNDAVDSSFKEVVDFGRMFSKAWWQQQARKNLTNRNFNANLWYMVMKNMFGWSDKSSGGEKAESQLTEDELNTLFKAAAEKFSKTHKA